MKKLLIASTALVATAGVAAADITFSGYGRFGVVYEEGRYRDANLNGAYDAGEETTETYVDQRLRLIITGTAESANGIGFTAQTRIQWDDANNTAGVTSDTVTSTGAGAIRAAAFHAKAGGLTLSIGNVSAQEATPGFYAGGLGYTGFMFVDPWSIGMTNHDIGFVTDGGDSTNGVVMVTYTMGAFTVRASHSESETSGDRVNVGVVYSANGYTVALSHQESDTATQDVTKLYVQGNIGGATVGLFVDDTTFGNSVGLTGTMAVGAATKVTLTAVAVENAAGSSENIGVSVNHDLGGGVSFGAGIADMGGNTYAEAGVQFNF